MTAPLTTRYGVSAAALAARLLDWGEPRYRAGQVLAGLFAQRRPLEELTELPAPLRARLAAEYPLALTMSGESRSRDDRTLKWLWRATDGAQVETVLMLSESQATVCVSSQAGCAMACSFCATGQAGFERNLTAGEMVEQVLRAQHASPQRVTHVVYMGMGEPLANYDAVWESVERLHDDVRISSRRITISTVGVVPGMRRLARARLEVTLAVALHAPDDRLRRELVPLNARYPIAEVLDAATEVARASGRRVTFEYACIAGVNDTQDHADALGRLLAAFRGPGGAHVNLIPLNPTAGYAGQPTDRARLRSFAGRLRTHGVTATVRRARGVEIDAACGQLRSRCAATAGGGQNGATPRSPERW